MTSLKKRLNSIHITPQKTLIKKRTQQVAVRIKIFRKYKKAKRKTKIPSVLPPGQRLLRQNTPQSYSFRNPAPDDARRVPKESLPVLPVPLKYAKSHVSLGIFGKHWESISSGEGIFSNDYLFLSGFANFVLRQFDSAFYFEWEHCTLLSLILLRWRRRASNLLHQLG